MFGSGITTLIISKEESGSLIEDASETILNEAKEQKGGSLSILLGTLGARLLGNLITEKGVTNSKIPRQRVMRAGEGRIRAGQDF